MADPEIDPASVSFFGHSLAAYIQFFALDVPALRGRDVLDVAAGPASFTAEACARKINAVAVDPRYGGPFAELSAQVKRDTEHRIAGIRVNRRLLRSRSFTALAAAEADQRASAARFLADYETHYIHNRYVGASLPLLPFFDGTFDLVLCAHLLFTYTRTFDFEWHVAACRELVRVSAGEVRLHPLCDFDGKPYAGLAQLRRELRAAGITGDVRAVEHERFPGSNAMLVLRRSAP